ncbi:hypothetical protein PM082_020633 [Marasmius tenuissimus]|nr:hypothetical protein PM082_020633 [Marasmius tenuissimus]
MGNNNLNIQINENARATVIVGEARATSNNGSDEGPAKLTNTNSSVPNVTIEPIHDQVPGPDSRKSKSFLSVLRLRLSRTWTNVRRFVYARLGLIQDDPMELGSVRASEAIPTSSSPRTLNDTDSAIGAGYRGRRVGRVS